MKVREALIMLAVASCVALAVPSIASAAELVQGGSRVPVGTAISATNTEPMWFQSTTGGSFRCNVSKMSGKVKKNDGTSINLEWTNVVFENEFLGPCAESSTYGEIKVRTQSSKNPWCMRSTTAGEWAVRYCEESFPQPVYLWVEGNVLSSCRYRASGDLGFTSNVGTQPLKLATTSPGPLFETNTVGTCYPDFRLSGGYEITANGSAVQVK